MSFKQPPTNPGLKKITTPPQSDRFVKASDVAPKPGSLVRQPDGSHLRIPIPPPDLVVSLSQQKRIAIQSFKESVLGPYLESKPRPEKLPRILANSLVSDMGMEES